MQIFNDVELIPNFFVVSDEMLRGGQPTAEGFQELKERGTKTVVNLREESWLVEEERRILEPLDIKLVSIPLSPFREPTDDEIEHFLEIVTRPEHQPSFVHCLHGMDRTGAMVCMYRMHNHGWTFDDAYAEMVANGFHVEFQNLRRGVLRFASRVGVLSGTFRAI